MNKTIKATIKSISLMAFGTATWLVCAVAMPHQQAPENTGFVSNLAQLAVGTAYADEDKKSDDDSESESKSKESSSSSSSSSSTTRTGSVCVSLALLAERQSADKTSEESKVSDEYSKKDSEDKSKAEEDGKAKAEHDSASKYESEGDNDGKSEHEEYAKESESKSKEHEDKSKEYEDKAKEYEASVASVEAGITTIEDVVSNCKTVSVTDGTPKKEPGVWIEGTPDEIDTILATTGGAAILINSAATQDASMESYREIRGE